MTVPNSETVQAVIVGVRASQQTKEILVDDIGRLIVTAGPLTTDDMATVSFSPGNPGPSANEYTTWAAAHSAVAMLGGVRIIVIDDSFISPAVIPAGIYDMENIIIAGGVGPQESPLRLLQIAIGVTLPNLREIGGPMSIDSRATASVVVPTKTLDGCILRNSVILTVTTGGAPFFEIGAAVGYEIVLINGATVVNSAALPIVSLVGGGSLKARVYGEASGFSVDFLTGPAGTLFPIVENGIVNAVNRTQTGFSGTVASPSYTSIPRWDKQGTASVPITVTTTGFPFTRILYDPTAGTFTLSAPASPNTGDRWAVKNVSSSAVAITISGNGTTIESPLVSFALAASFALGSDGVAVTWEFDGTNWLVI